ncbi:MAG: hypothetical protein P9C48_01300 [Defluviicoccus sp.]|nr:hypothetical protein [Defluviicoccus sp.]MDG4607749.1 hypothetical protein [Defluviicoccus sp.]
MKRFRDIVLASRALDAGAIARYIEMFADRSPEWTFPAEQSATYQQMCQEPSCCIICEDNSLPRAAIHMTKARENSLYTANIVPLHQDNLSIDQYNAIGTKFARSVRTYAKTTVTAIAVTVSKAEISLADVVTGQIPRRLLRRYLSQYPLSHHQSDIDRLDAFICSLSRYSRKPFDIDAFEYLLMEELYWSHGDARWCRTRVEIGLDVLAANRKFRA